MPGSNFQIVSTKGNIAFKLLSFSFYPVKKSPCQIGLKYGLFNGFIFLTIKKFLLSYFPNFHGQGSGGQDLSMSYLKQSCFIHGEGSFKEPIHKQFYSK